MPTFAVKEMIAQMKCHLQRTLRSLVPTVVCLFAVGLLCGTQPASAAPNLEANLTNAANQIQAVVVYATGGQLRLRYGSGGPGVSETGDISATATAVEVESALNSLGNISSGGGSVTVARELPGAANNRVYYVSFDGGPLAHTEATKITASDGTTPLSSSGEPKIYTWVSQYAGVSRSEGRVDYALEITNTSPKNPVVGSLLTCNGVPPAKAWVFATSFSYQWAANGVVIPGASSSTYSVQAGDVGKAIQCFVTGANEAGTGAAIFASQPPVVVEPQPATAPPSPKAPTGSGQRPPIAGPFTPGTETAAPWEAGKELTCAAPAADWNGNSISWSFRWLRDGLPAPGAVTSPSATTSRYVLDSTDVSAPAAPAVFQCEAIATNVGGGAAVFSNNKPTAAPAPAFSTTVSAERNPNQSAANTPEVTSTVSSENTTNGTVTAELELPGGTETYAYNASGEGWSCNRIPASGLVHAKAVCTRSDALIPGASYPKIDVRAAPGADAPSLAIARATVSGGGAAVAGAEDQFAFQPLREFGLRGFEATISGAGEVPFTQAGGHPLEGTGTFPFIRKNVLVPGGAVSGNYAPIEEVKQVFTDLPRGQVANALAVPELCPSFEQECGANFPGSRVGIIRLLLSGFGAEGVSFPIFALKPEFGTPAQFAFQDPTGAVYTISAGLRADDGYGITLEVAPAPEVSLLRARAQICNFGVKGGEGEGNLACKTAGEADPDGAGPLTGGNPVPLFTNPTRCGEPAPVVGARLNSWEHPTVLKHYEFTAPQITDCDEVHFEPKVKLEPTSRRADSPTGLDVSITMPTDGLEDPFGISQSNLDNATVTFPKGMSINPATADGLGACTEAQVKLGSNEPEECPPSSKVGTVEIETPLIQEALTGNVYVARQKDNPFKTTLGLYMVFSSKKDGITIKVAGKLVPDPVTGQLTSTFVENPEDPFSRLVLHFNSGPRAPLVNPPKCGSYAIHSELSPWSAANPANPTQAEIAAEDSSFEVTEGPGGSPCPDGGLDPKLKAGLQDSQAGAKSPFLLTLSREDGSQRFTALDISTPRGLTAYLKGIPYCSESALAGISTAELTGATQLARSSCPAASQVGTVLSGAGAGPFPFQAPGRVYLAGPYKGAPISLVVVAPAVAGPFDLGNVVVRNALYVDPVSAQVTAKSDPIPTILHGILLDIRQIRLALDRPGFTAAPTNCEPMAIKSTVSGEGGARASISNRFQASNCAALGFKPKLTLRLFGGTKRGAHPRLKAVLSARAGDANIAGASVALPHSEFLDQAHIRTICTRVQFAAGACPVGAIYGRARAITPLLDSPVEGPVYLRSSDNPLPDLVAALRGPDDQPIEVVLAGRIDSVHGGIRNTFEAVPDQPVTKFTLTMQGGKKGLLVNSRDICNSTARATVRLSAQNGRTASLRPKLRNSCGRKGKAAKGKHRRHRAR